MAKKRYYQGAKDRKDESVAMMGKSSGSFNGEFNEDPSAPSRLPQQSVYKNWVKPGYESYDLENSDNVRGIDSQMNDDVNQARKHRSKTKY